MAIYKPSNCTPFLTAKDLTEGFDISCELNTSNEIVTGYKIRILDSKNNLVYEGDEYSKINIPKKGKLKGEAIDGVGEGYSNTGLNGSILILPLVVNLGKLEATPPTSEMRKNIIYHYADNTTAPSTDKFGYYDGTNFIDINTKNNPLNTNGNPYLFTNQSANQPFKWEITLAQGQPTFQEELSQAPNSNRYYDMTVSTGKILGSCGERIQSYLSEYIYKDYYLQLYSDAGAETQLGQRVRISSYDHSYGYIYPQEGTLDDGTVQNAKSFQVFKDTNDPQYVSATRKVDYISYSNPLTYTPMGIPKEAEVTLDTNTNTLTIIYEGGSGYDLLSNYVDGIASDLKLTSNTSILFVTFENGDFYPPHVIGYSSSKYNGVWQFVSCTVADGKTTVNWQRPSAFSNYAAYIGRVINVANGTYGARNYSCDAQPDIGGKINETALTFYDETPVGLYPAYNKKKEVINKTYSDKFSDQSGATYSKVIATPAGDLVNNVVSAKFTNLDPEEKAQIMATPAGGNHIKISCSGLTSKEYKYTITYNYLTSIAPVLKTGYNVNGDVNAKVVYLNPSINVENDMKLFSGNNLLNNYTVSDFDNEPNLDNKFSPTYSAVLTANDGVETYPKLNDDYEIRSFFKISDENPFYAYDTPTITIDVSPKIENYDAEFYDNNVASVNFVTLNNYIEMTNYSYIVVLKNSVGVSVYTASCYDDNNKGIKSGISIMALSDVGVNLYDNTKDSKVTIINGFDYKNYSGKSYPDTDFIATNRYVDVSATYTQNQNKSWKSFYWTLEDENGYIKAFDKTYVGEIATTFLGLESGKSYDLTLYLEDEMGNFYTITKTVYCGAEVDTETKVDFNGTLNCDDYAVDIHVGANGLIDEPAAQKDVVLSYNNGMQITGSGDRDEPLVSYEHIKLGPTQSSIPNIFTDESKPVKLVSEHTGLASNFEGGIIEYQIGDETVGAYLESLVVDSDVEINGEKLTKVNSNRNNIYFKNNVTPNKVSWQSDDGLDMRVLSTWIPKNSTRDSTKEYIDSDISPRSTTDKTWVNIKGVLNNQNSSGKIVMPFNAESNSGTGNNISIWSDRKIEYDSDGAINVFVLNKNSNDYEYNTWEDTWKDGMGNEHDYYWQDAPAGSGEIKEYEDSSAQTNLRNQTFKFEFDKAVGEKNYKVIVTQTGATTNKTTEVEING